MMKNLEELILYQDKLASQKPLKCKELPLGTILYSELGRLNANKEFKVIYSNKGYIILEDKDHDFYPEPQITLGKNLFLSKLDVGERIENLILNKEYRCSLIAVGTAGWLSRRMIQSLYIHYDITTVNDKSTRRIQMLVNRWRNGYA